MKKLIKKYLDPFEPFPWTPRSRGWSGPIKITTIPVGSLQRLSLFTGNEYNGRRPPTTQSDATSRGVSERNRRFLANNPNTAKEQHELYVKREEARKYAEELARIRRDSGTISLGYDWDVATQQARELRAQAELNFEKDLKAKQEAAVAILALLSPLLPSTYAAAIGKVTHGEDITDAAIDAYSGNHQGFFELSDNLKLWGNEHPYWQEGLNIVGDLAVPVASNYARIGLLNLAKTPAVINLTSRVGLLQGGIRIGNSVYKFGAEPGMLYGSIVPPILKVPAKISKEVESIMSKLPEGTKYIKTMPNGMTIVRTPEGKTVVAEKAYKDLLKTYGYDLQKIISDLNEAVNSSTERPYFVPNLEDNPQLWRAYDDIISGKASVYFPSNSLLEPNGGDVLAALYWNRFIDPNLKSFGVGFIGTKPVNVTPIDRNFYLSSNKFGSMVSATDTPESAIKYGYYDYDAIENFINTSGLRPDLREYGLYLLNRIRQAELVGTGKNYVGLETTLGNLTKSARTKLEQSASGYGYNEYFQDIDALNKFLSGSLLYGARTHRMVYPSVSSRSILTIKASDNPGSSMRFGDHKASLDIPLRDYLGRELLHYDNKGGVSGRTATTRLTFGNILDAERTVGGYTRENKFGVREFVPGWNLSIETQRILEGMDLNTPLHVFGIGPNGVNVPDMRTLLVLRARPSFDKGGVLKNIK